MGKSLRIFFKEKEMKRYLPLACALFVLAVAATSLSASGVTYVIKAKKIYTVTQGIIQDGMIVVEDGKIARVGRNIPVPEGATEIAADTVIPGLVDMHSHLGVYSVPAVKENEDGNEMTEAVTPQVRALDSFNFGDPSIDVARAGGVTTIVSRPGSANVIGGTSVAVKLKKAPPNEMVLKEDCDLKMTIEGNPVAYQGRYGRTPTSMMGVYFLAEKAFIEAREYMKSWEKYEADKKRGVEASPPKRDLGKEHLVMALKREIPVHIHVCTTSEIMSCIRLADEFGFKLSLAHCQWGYLIKDELAKRKEVHFNVGPAMFFTYFGQTFHFKNCPAILANAGANVSLQIDAVEGRQPGQQHLLHTASLCVRYGMHEDDALKAITIRGAEAVNLDRKIGSIEEGKDADLVFLNGKPLEWLTSVEKVMIDGKMEYEREDLREISIDSSIPKAEGSLSIPDQAFDSKNYAIRCGTILPMTGAKIKDGIILIHEGKISKIGRDIRIPENYPVIDAHEFVVTPGLISARSQIGISSNWLSQSSTDEISNPVTPELEVKHAVEPQDPMFAAARRLGVTTVMITPGDRNVIGGQGLVVKTAGAVVDKMVLKKKAAMMFGLGSSAKRENVMPSTRMGMAALIRQSLANAVDYKNRMENRENEDNEASLPRDFSSEALIPVIKGEMPVMVHCEREDDILTAIRIADEFHLKIVLTGASEAYKVVDEIQKRHIPVVLEQIFRGGRGIEDRDSSDKNAAILSQSGIKVNFTLGDYLAWYIPMGLMGADPLEIAAYAFKNGMSEEAALRSITIDAAEIIGCSDRVGSLEPGKDADILILRGHPFMTHSVPEAVLIDGKIVFTRKKDDFM
jgi:imidazolonepropionase-like amidohydrolase